MSDERVEETRYKRLLLSKAPEMIISSREPGTAASSRPRHVPYMAVTKRRTKTGKTMWEGSYVNQAASSSSSPPEGVVYGEVGPISGSSAPIVEVKEEENDVELEPTSTTIASVLESLGPENPDQEGPSEMPPAEMTEEERLAKKIEEEQNARYREVGRRFCELEMTDFYVDEAWRTGRKNCQIASRGEAILEVVRRNLRVIQEKLGDFAQGTIFEDVDAIADQFAVETPNVLTRLNEFISERIRETGYVPPTDVKSEEPETSEVKMEPDDDYVFDD